MAVRLRQLCGNPSHADDAGSNPPAAEGAARPCPSSWRRRLEIRSTGVKHRDLRDNASHCVPVAGAEAESQRGLCCDR